MQANSTGSHRFIVNHIASILTLRLNYTISPASVHVLHRLCLTPPITPAVALEGFLLCGQYWGGEYAIPFRLGQEANGIFTKDVAERASLRAV